MKKLFIAIFWLSAFGCQHKVTTIYHLPKNFEGFFAVIYSQPNAASSDIKKEIRRFYVPSTGILLTNGKFYKNGNDIFLMQTDEGYDTLRTFVPINEEDKRKNFSNEFEKKFTNDANKIAINLRVFSNIGFNKLSADGQKKGECNFFYEMVTVGKANSLSDSMGKSFKKRLESYMQDSLCR